MSPTPFINKRADGHAFGKEMSFPQFPDTLGSLRRRVSKRRDDRFGRRGDRAQRFIQRFVHGMEAPLLYSVVQQTFLLGIELNRHGQ